MKGYETCGARNAEENFGSRAEKQPSIVSLTVLTPAAARNCGRFPFHAEPPEVVTRAQPYTAASLLNGIQNRGQMSADEESVEITHPGKPCLWKSCGSGADKRGMGIFSPCTRSLHLGSVTSPEPYGAGGLL